MPCGPDDLALADRAIYLDAQAQQHIGSQSGALRRFRLGSLGETKQLGWHYSVWRVCRRAGYRIGRALGWAWDGRWLASARRAGLGVRDTRGELGANDS